MGYFSEDVKNRDRAPRENEDYTEPATRSGMVAKARYINVRKRPSRTGESIGQLMMGDRVEILGQDGDYYRIAFEPCPIAYVAAHFIEED